VRDGAFYVVRFSRSPDNDRIAEQGQETRVFAIAATKVLGVGRGDTFSPTRWRWRYEQMRAAVEALPFGDEAFDVMTSSLMMHHLPADLKPRPTA
jgi:hypothetical protein